ncbi:hypothetical protein BHE74_00051850, partial [Ensete ventricosum]
VRPCTTRYIPVRQLNGMRSSRYRAGERYSSYRLLRSVKNRFEVVDRDVVFRGNFRFVCRWQRKLRSSPKTVEGATHESSG